MDALSMLRGSSGNISLSRTQAILGFLVCSGILIWQAYKGELSEAIFIAYFGFQNSATAPPPRSNAPMLVNKLSFMPDLARQVMKISVCCSWPSPALPG